jgi:membrane-bound metal-dependent hydrolase YbcI (DUF457 family)
MDNLAHSLIGAALGRAGATRQIRFAGFLGALAGNAPDLSEFLTGDIGPGAQYLARHRGHTHSILGLVLELAVLMAAGWFFRRRLFGENPPGPRQVIAALLFALAPALASHLLLDWTGSYGLRPFLPWSGQWYYGDVIPIVDVLFWVVPLGVLAWGSTRDRRWGGWWALLAAAPTVLVFMAPVGLPIRLVWLAGLAVAGLGWWRGWFGAVKARQAALAGLSALALYAAVCTVGHGRALGVARREAQARFGPAAAAAALTEAGAFFRWELVYATEDSVVGREYDWIGDRLARDGWEVPRNLDRPEVRRALDSTAQGRAIGMFARYLTADLRREGDHALVVLRDARYARSGTDGWAVVTVPLPLPPGGAP